MTRCEDCGWEGPHLLCGTCRQARTIMYHRQEGRDARLAGKTEGHCPYFPFVGANSQKPLFYVSAGQEWLIGWKELDALMRHPEPDPASESSPSAEQPG